MPRSISSAVETQIHETTNTSAHLIEVTYWNGSEEQIIRITTASQDIETNADGEVPNGTWLGIGLPSGGSPLGIGTSEETKDSRAQSLDLTLDGVDTSIVAVIQGNGFRGRPIKLWKIWLNPDTGVIDASLLMWSGLQNDNWEISESNSFEEKSVTLSTRVVSRLAILARSKPVLTNVNSHSQMLNRGDINVIDTGFSTVPSLNNKVIQWGPDAVGTSYPSSPYRIREDGRKAVSR